MAAKKSISIRRSLLSNLLIVVVVLSGAIFITTTWGIRQAVELLSRSLINQTTERTESELNVFFTPVIQQLRTVGLWGRQGMLDVTDPASLNRMFVPLIENFPQISSVLLADTGGREYLLLHTEDKWMNRETRTVRWGGKSRITRWSAENPAPVVSWKTLNYDPYKRPWYQGAIGSRKSDDTSAGVHGAAPVFWTKPYIFFTTKDLGITASLAFETADGLPWVIAFDLLLTDITKFTMGLKVSEHGQVVVLSDDQFRVIGLPRHRLFSDPAMLKASLLKTPEQLGVPVLMDTMKAYRREEVVRGEAYRVESGGHIWWVGVRTYPLSPERKLYITVVVPENDLLGKLKQMRIWIVAIALAVLLLAVVNVIFLAGRYSRPIEALVAESRRMSKGDLDPGVPIDSRVMEFKRLAQAHDQMREGLQSLLKMEKDMQLASRIQRDTFPEVLPDIKGYQIAAWAEPAEQTGGDTYDVVGLRGSARDGSLRLTMKNVDSAVFLLADATGHGIGPALSVTQVRAMLRIAVRMGWDIAAIIKHVNAQLCWDLKEGRFISAWLGRLDAARHRLTSFSAGQAPFFHFDAANHTCRIFSADMPPLGLLEEARIEIGEPVVLNPGDLFVVTSDGLIEPSNAGGELFGKQRLIDVLKAHHLASPEDILAALLAEIERFTGNAPPDDDRTAIIIKRQT